jgi:hypothetical protein
MLLLQIAGRVHVLSDRVREVLLPPAVSSL